MSLQVYQVNAFADGPDCGNPAGVCLLSGADLLAACTDAVRQKVAARVGLSETAFVEPAGPDAGRADAFAALDTFKLRWFTPTTEVPLCGHATMAAAAVIFAECGNPAPALKFDTLSGLLVVTRGAGEVAAGSLTLKMSLPLAEPGDPLPASFNTELVHGGPDSIGGAKPSRALTALLWPCLQSLDAPCVPEQPRAQAPGRAPDWPSHWLASVVAHVGFAAPLKYLLVVLKPGFSGAQLAALKPDTTAMAEAVAAEEVTGVIVAAGSGRSDGAPDAAGYDLYARFFGPWAGIPEDPVTGSAYTVVGPYFSLALLGGRQALCARQCSARGGDVGLDLGSEPGRVVVSGRVVVVPAGGLGLALGEL